jgi:hypothetical protein
MVTGMVEVSFDLGRLGFLPWGPMALCLECYGFTALKRLIRPAFLFYCLYLYIIA